MSNFQNVTLGDTIYEIPINPKAFTEFGDAFWSGKFNGLNPESHEYRELWQEQYNRCILGYSVGGQYMSGTLYGYVNFGKIQLLEDPNATLKRKVYGRPQLRDIEWILDRETRAAQAEGTDLLYVTGRRAGKSYYGGWIITDNFVFWNDNSLIACGHQEKGDELKDKVVDNLIALKDTPFFTPWIGNCNDDKDPIIAGYEYKKDKKSPWLFQKLGGKIDLRNFKNNKTAANGLSTRRAIVEEIGMFDNLIASHGAMKYCWREGSRSFGFAMFQGTGGDMEKGSTDAAMMFDEPEAYNLRVFHDELNPTKKICFFLPGYYAFNDCRDKNGIVDAEKGLKLMDENREKAKKAKKLDVLLDEIQYVPKTYKEAFLKKGSGFFPREIIQEQITRLESDPTLLEFGTRGFVKYKGGILTFEPDDMARDAVFPVSKKNDNTGCVKIFEHPQKIGEKIPSGLYVAGLDPFNYDDAETSVSLGSLTIYKRIVKGGTGVFEWPVATYTGRPNKVSDYNEQSRLLLMYYGIIGNCLYENMNTKFQTHLEKQRCLYLLATQPRVLDTLLERSEVKRTYGVHASPKIRIYFLGLIRDWLLTEYSPGHYNVELIYDIELLKELLAYDSDTNCDRVDSFGFALMQNEERFNHLVEATNKDSQYNPFSTFDRMNGWSDGDDEDFEYSDNLTSTYRDENDDDVVSDLFGL